MRARNPVRLRSNQSRLQVMRKSRIITKRRSGLLIWAHSQVRKMCRMELIRSHLHGKQSSKLIRKHWREIWWTRSLRLRRPPKVVSVRLEINPRSSRLVLPQSDIRAKFLKIISSSQLVRLKIRLLFWVSLSLLLRLKIRHSLRIFWLSLGVLNLRWK